MLTTVAAAAIAATPLLSVTLVGEQSPPEFSFGVPGRKQAPRIMQIIVATASRSRPSHASAPTLISTRP
jgi:hypothetical protein